MGAGAPDERGSPTAAEAGELAVAVGAENLVLTHMGKSLRFAAGRAQGEAVFPDRSEMASPG